MSGGVNPQSRGSFRVCGRRPTQRDRPSCDTYLHGFLRLIDSPLNLCNSESQQRLRGGYSRPLRKHRQGAIAMKLFFAPGACSFAPHIILREAALPFDLEKVDLAAHKTATDADYYGITSKGMVPLLQLDDGSYLSEGPTIVQYVCDKAERRDLMPVAGTMERYRVMEWQNYITAELHKGFSPLFNPTFDPAAKAAFSALLRKRFEWVAGQLKNRTFLTGETFTGADAYLFTVAQWARYVSLDLRHLTDLQSYLQRVAIRPAVQQALKAEGLSK